MVTRVAAAVVAMMLAGGSWRAAASECFTIPVAVAQAYEEADLVAAGTLTAAGEDVFTLRVDTVWKGQVVGRDVPIHVIGSGFVGQYLFVANQRYLLFAQTLPTRERLFSEPRDQAVPYSIHRPCGQPTWPLTLIPELDRLTPPRTFK